MSQPVHIIDNSPVKATPMSKPLAFGHQEPPAMTIQEIDDRIRLAHKRLAQIEKSVRKSEEQP